MRAKQLLGVPFLYAIAASAVGFSIYFSIGVVAERGLGLTPAIFLAAGVLFAITTLTYVDPALGIPWPIDKPTLSAKDAKGQRLADVPAERLIRWSTKA
jgi:hypothetical protein